MVRNEIVTFPHSPGKCNNKILLDLTSTLHSDVETEQVRVLMGGLKAIGERGCLVPAILMEDFVWGCKLEFGESV